MGGVALEVAVSRELSRWKASRKLLLQCLLAAGVGLFGLADSEHLLSLALFLFLPVVVFRAANSVQAFLVALTYYLVGARAVPGIIAGFFPGLTWAECVFLWMAHAALLSLLWAVAFAPRHTAPAILVARVVLLFVVLSVPPVGLFHWGSPLMAAGLLYPGFQYHGVLLTLFLYAALIVCKKQMYLCQAAVAAALFISVIANVVFSVPDTPKDWRAISLQLGKAPALWSDEMHAMRERLVDIASREILSGAKVVVFPESVSGSNIRPQEELWYGVAAEASRRGSTILLGQETWDAARTGFKNSLIGYGAEVADNSVVVSSIVPMPMGEWKFGIEKGAQTNIFASDIVYLQGRYLSFSMCYEDFLLWPHRGLLSGKAEIFVSVANQWPSSGTSSEVFQDTSRKSLARLAGVPMLVAKNR